MSHSFRVPPLTHILTCIYMYLIILTSLTPPSSWRWRLATTITPQASPTMQPSPTTMALTIPTAASSCTSWCVCHPLPGCSSPSRARTLTLLTEPSVTWPQPGGCLPQSLPQTSRNSSRSSSTYQSSLSTTKVCMCCVLCACVCVFFPLFFEEPHLFHFSFVSISICDKIEL